MSHSLLRTSTPIAHLLTAVMRIAAEHHRGGRTAAATTLYREVLAMDPHHADALFLLAVLERQAGRLEAARALLLQAAQWAGDRTLIDRELHLVESLQQRQPRKPVQRTASASLALGDSCALIPAHA